MTKTDPSPPASGNSPKTYLLGFLPLLSLLLFLSALTILVWLTKQYDADEQQATLISDALWIEQNLHFQFERNENLLAQYGHNLLTKDPLSSQNQAQLRQLLSQNTGLVRIIWLDKAGRKISDLPPIPEDQPEEALTPFLPLAINLKSAHALGRPIYEPVYQGEKYAPYLKVIVPIWLDRNHAGTLVGIYALSNLLGQELPWWFSERYRLAVMAPDGEEIAAKSKVAPLATKHNYTLPFDPPGNHFSLHITPYKNKTRWIAILLTASILLLGLITLWSIWQLRRQLTRRQAAEQALREAFAYRKAMEDSLTTGLRARDLDGYITYVNPAFCRMTGYSAEELIGHAPPLPYWEPNYVELRTQKYPKLLRDGALPEGVEIRFKRKNGNPLDILLFEAPLIDAQGCHTGWMGSVLDITEQKRSREIARQQEERLQATSRLVTMGEMASTLAHELNQPLAAIASYNTGCLNRLRNEYINRTELYEIHEKIAHQARRAGKIIHRVYDFVRRAPSKSETLNLNLVIQHALILLELDAKKHGATLIATLSPDLPSVCADPVLIEQVIVNLVRNAIDAMRDTQQDERIVNVFTMKDNTNTVVRITDRGCGIAPDIAEHLFEPFFTTKTEGMGIGLNICRSIAELYRGRLSFETNPDHSGTTMTLTLPAIPA